MAGVEKRIFSKASPEIFLFRFHIVSGYCI